MESITESLTTPLEIAGSAVFSVTRKLPDLATPEVCVICLDRISDRATAFPCRHDHFHFPCLGTWLQHQQRCPLCKEEVSAVRYKTETSGSALFQLPQDEARLPRQQICHVRRQRRTPPFTSGERSPLKNFSNEDAALTFRRSVYVHNLYSMHVGSNRHSRYLPSGSITPELLKRSPRHLSRARAFIRRELTVFDFLDPSSPAFTSVGTMAYRNGSIELPRRKATNREFLLGYVIAVVQSIPLKGSEGQAETLLAEYLGVGNARLFLHELESWLRSPYERLGEWDQRVQYPRPLQGTVNG